MKLLARPGCSRGGVQRLHRDLVRATRSVRVSGRHIHLGDGALAPLAPLIKRCSPGTSVSLRLHGLDVVYPHPLYQRMLRSSLPSCDRVVCISRATAEQARVRGAREEQIVVIPPGIWRDEVAESKSHRVTESPVLLTVGRLIPRKGHVWFIDNVLPLLPGVRYVIVGSGPEERRIRQVVRERGLFRRVRLICGASDTVRDACYREADLFVMPNVPVEGDMEGFGIVCLEASARGLPVVAAKLEGIPDAVAPETGVLFEPGSPSACAEAIHSLLRNRPDPVEISRATLERFSWDTLIHRYCHDVFAY